jgi:hypothetical protein
MIESLTARDAAPAIERPVSQRVCVLTRDFQARMINYSPSGCLLETNAPLEIGTVGTLRFVIDGREFADDIQVVRCQPIEGAGSLYQVGAKFLWTMGACGRESLRHALDILPANGQPVRSPGASPSASRTAN